MSRRSFLAIFLLLFLAIAYQPDVRTAASQNNLTLLLQQIDAGGTPVLNRTIGPIQYAGNVGVFTSSIFNDTSAHSQSLPVTNVLQFYFKNTHATAKFTLIWTRQGGASATVQVVEPGGVIAFWMPSTTGTAGITALSLTSDTSGGTYEMFLGG